MVCYEGENMMVVGFRYSVLGLQGLAVGLWKPVSARLLGNIEYRMVKLRRILWDRWIPRDVGRWKAHPRCPKLKYS